MKPHHPAVIVFRSGHGSVHIYPANNRRHKRAVAQMAAVHAASLPAPTGAVREAALDKQDPPALAGTEGSNRSTSGDSDGRAASAHGDRGR